MDAEMRSPRIAEFSWGRVEVEGVGTFKDAMLYPGGAREWDWRENGTSHVPGIQPADVEELLERGATIVVLSRGVLRRLQVDPRTLELLADRALNVHVHQSERAVELYNELCEKEHVGALIHSTC